MNRESQLEGNLEGALREDTGQEEEFSSSPQQRSPFLSYLRTFRRKALLIAIVTSLTTLGAFLWTRRDPDIYTGSFTLLVEPLSSEEKVTDVSTLARTGGVPNEGLLGLDYPTQIAILRSPDMLDRIAERVGQRYPFFSQDLLRSTFDLNLLIERPQTGKSRFDVTKMIRVSYASSDSELVQIVLEEAAEEFLKYSLEERKSSIASGVSFIDQQLPQLRAKVKNLEEKLKTIQNQYKIVDPVTRTQELFTQINELNNQEVEAQNKLRELRQLYNNLEKQVALNPDEALLASSLNQNPERLNILAKIQEIDNQIASASARFTPNAPQLRTLAEERQNLQELLSQKNAEILVDKYSKVVDNPQIDSFQDSIRLNLIGQLIQTANEIDVLQVRYQSLQNQRMAIEQTAKQFPEISVQYSDLVKELELTNQILNRLLTQRQTLQVEDASKDFPWNLVTKPHIPLNARGELRSTKPENMKKILAGFMGGLVVSSTASILLEKSRDIFYSSKDLQDLISLVCFKFLGEIFISTETTSRSRSIFNRFLNSNENVNNLDSWLEVEPGQLEDRYQAEKSLRHSRFNNLDITFWLSLVKRNSLAGLLFLRESIKLEGFELLYSRLRFLYRDRPVRSLVVTSVESEDGQSLVAFNLAQAALTKNERVLLIDMNGYKPQFYNWSNLDEDRDLLERIEITWSKEMESVMEQLEAKYDLIIYDTPHFFESSNIKFLASHTDGFLMVVRIGKTSQVLVKQAIAQIREFNLPVVGVVATVFKLPKVMFQAEGTQKSKAWGILPKKPAPKSPERKSSKPKEEPVATVPQVAQGDNWQEYL